MAAKKSATKRGKVDAKLRGPELVRLAIERISIHRPQPVPEHEIAKLTLGGAQLPPSLRTWLRHHARLPRPAGSPLFPDGLGTAPWRGLGMRALGREALFMEPPPPLTKGTFLPLDVGDEQFRAMFVGEPDEYGEYPIVDIDSDEVAVVELALPGFDVWLAVVAGLVPPKKVRTVYRDALGDHARRNFGDAVAWEHTGRWTSHADAVWEPPRGYTIPKRRGAPDPVFELIEIIRERDHASARALLEEGVDAIAADHFGRVPIFHAAAAAEPEIIVLLLARGASPEARDADIDHTPLSFIAAMDWWHYAKVQPSILDGWLRCLRLLVAGGADPNRTNEHGFVPIHDAVTRRSFALVSTLLELGADPRIAQPDGRGNALHALLAKPMGRKTQPAHDVIACLELLLSRGVDPNAVDAEGNTPLHVASADPGTPDAAFAMLLAGGASAETKNSDGQTWKDVRQSHEKRRNPFAP